MSGNESCKHSFAGVQENAGESGALAERLSSSGTGLSCPDASAAPACVDRGAAIPDHYGRDQIVAEVRDPNCIFVYWDQQGPRREEVRLRYGADVFEGACWILRLCSEGDGSQDVPIMPEGRNWYLHVPENREYAVEIGILSRDGQFITLSRSNTVRTPRKDPSDDGSCEWMLVEGDFLRVIRLTNGKPSIQVGEFGGTLRSLPMGSSGLLGREHLAGSMRDGAIRVP